MYAQLLHKLSVICSTVTFSSGIIFVFSSMMSPARTQELTITTHETTSIRDHKEAKSPSLIKHEAGTCQAALEKTAVEAGQRIEVAFVAARDAVELVVVVVAAAAAAVVESWLQLEPTQEDQICKLDRTLPAKRNTVRLCFGDQCRVELTFMARASS